MNKMLPKIILTLCVVLAGLFTPSGKAYAAPSLLFDKTAVSVAQNATFQLKININVDSNTTLGSDAIVQYAGSDLEVLSVTSGGFYPDFGQANDPSGRLEIHGYTSSTNDSRTGNGVLATIVFKAKKGAGSSSVSYNCTANGSNSNILTTLGQNILNCTNTNIVSVSYTGAPTNTVTPTATTAPGNTATPTQIPGGTNTVPSCASLYTDISSAVGTPLAVTLTCSGIDPDGYINAAEFTFGDGTKQTVEKNAGSPGSIATTHTYTTIGTLGASCRVRDNNAVWSSVPENCNKTITIKQRPASTATPTPYRGSTAYVTPTITPTPTSAVVTLITDTPYPSLSVSPVPTLYLGDDSDNGGTDTDNTGSDRFWWIVGGIIAVILAFLLLRRKNPPQTPPNVPLTQ